ncbi:MAG: hypothetical protein KKC18_03590 [Chloroflexi bacterium]|nr:hypothetical protein [Chloroflexota bacterium]
MTDDLTASQKRAEREIAEGAAEVECGFQVIRQTGRAEITALRSHWTSTFGCWPRAANLTCPALLVRS